MKNYNFQNDDFKVSYKNIKFYDYYIIGKIN